MSQSRHTVIRSIIALVAVLSMGELVCAPIRAAIQAQAPQGSKIEEALALIDAGEIDAGFQQLEQLASTPGGDASSSLALARAYNRLQEFDKAATQARSVLDRGESPEVRARAHTQLGLALLELALREKSKRQGAKLLTEADDSLRRALDLGGDQVNAARYYRAEIISARLESTKIPKGKRQGLYTEIASLLETFLALDPEPSVARRARTLLCGGPACTPAEKVDLDRPGSVGERRRGSRPAENVQAPKLIRSDPPRYTPAARKARVQGSVTLQAELSKEGEVVAVRVLRGLPFGLTEAAVQAMKAWTFEPALYDGEPVRVYYNTTIVFSLK